MFVQKQLGYFNFLIPRWSLQLLVILCILWPIHSAATCEQAMELTDTMMRGCGLGTGFKIEFQGDGSLSIILKRGVEGKFQYSEKEIPSILEFLAKDDRVTFSDRMLKCTEKFLDRIFDACLDQRFSSSPIDEGSAFGVVFKLYGCVPDGTDILCTLEALSTQKDFGLVIKGLSRYGKFTKVGTVLFNQNGYQYIPTEVRVADLVINPKFRDGFWRPNHVKAKHVVRNVPVQIVLRFKDAALESSSIPKLVIGGAVGREGFSVSFRNISVASS